MCNFPLCRLSWKSQANDGFQSILVFILTNTNWMWKVIFKNATVVELKIDLQVIISSYLLVCLFNYPPTHPDALPCTQLNNWNIAKRVTNCEQCRLTVSVDFCSLQYNVLLWKGRSASYFSSDWNAVLKWILGINNFGISADISYI